MTKNIKELERIIWDCLVIGAGPAGSYASYLLSKKGARVILIERGKMPGEKKACGGCLSFFFIDRLGIEEIIEKIMYEAEIYFNGKNYKFKSKMPMGIMIKRSIFDFYLAKKAEAAGTTLLCGYYAYEINEKNVTVSCHSSFSNEKVLFKGKCILLADGAKTIGNKLGIGFDINTQDFIYAIKSDIRTESVSEAMKFFIDLENINIGYYWIFSKNNLYNIGVGAKPKEKNISLHWLLEKFLKKHFSNIVYEKLNTKGGVVPLETAKKFALEKVVVLGDAAGFVNPITGGGIHYALKSAEIVANAVAKRLKKNKPINLRICNYLLKLNSYYIWLKIMRIALSFIYLLGNYKGLIYHYFLRIYFRFFFFLGNIIYSFKAIFSR